MKICAMEPHLPLKRFPPSAGVEPGTARSAGQPLTKGLCSDTELQLGSHYILGQVYTITLSLNDTEVKHMGHAGK